MECDCGGQRNRNLTLVFTGLPFPHASRPKISRTKMVDGSVNCEAAFLNFSAEFKQTGKVFSLSLLSFVESKISQKTLYCFLLIICLDLVKHLKVSQISFARQRESL